MSMDHRDMRAETGGMMAGTALYKKSVFTKRTQLKNVEVLWNEWVRRKNELGSFCKKREKRGKKQGINGEKSDEMGDFGKE